MFLSFVTPHFPPYRASFVCDPCNPLPHHHDQHQLSPDVLVTPVADVPHPPHELEAQQLARLLRGHHRQHRQHVGDEFLVVSFSHARVSLHELGVMGAQELEREGDGGHGGGGGSHLLLHALECGELVGGRGWS